ncbi:hypothetical protein AB4571_02390 [Vibrio breoganii]|uniref:hypothetical protein n=1 Tax=Vibrio breoganii TaxID=553239 RepID=UPI0010564F26|nr:hypothetical protein [Vibrio breoganii]
MLDKIKRLANIYAQAVKDRDVDRVESCSQALKKVLMHLRSRPEQRTSDVDAVVYQLKVIHGNASQFLEEEKIRLRGLMDSCSEHEDQEKLYAQNVAG